MGAGRNLEHTPAVVVFCVFIFFLIVSYLIEQIFHKLDHYFEHHHLLGLKTALGKVKEELMLMGFCSLVLIVCEEDILGVCVNIRDIQGIPAQVSAQCPCSHMYYRDFVNKPLDGSSSSGSGSGSGSESTPPRSSVFDLVTGPIYKCGYTNEMCGPDWSVLMCCSKYPNFRTMLGDESMSGEECETQYKIQAGATNVTSHVSGHRLLWDDGPRRSLGGTGTASTCPPGTEKFIHQAALHQTHTIIFYIAMLHITLGCSVMWVASRRVSHFAKWEQYGDDADENAENLNVPEDRKGIKRIVCSCKEQFTQSVDPASYIAIRRFYISKNVKLHDHPPETFQFNTRIQRHMNEKFGDILGIHPLMWFTLGCQIVLEGYGAGSANIFTQISFVFMLAAGAKLQMVNDHLTRTVYKTYDCVQGDAHGKGCMQVDKLQNLQISTDYAKLKFYEPEFWLQDPAIIETIMKFCIWQIAVSVTLFLYFGGQYEMTQKFHTCFWESRTAARMTPDLILMFGTLVVAAFQVMPVYGVVSLAANHNKVMQKRRKKKSGGHGEGHDEAATHDLWSSAKRFSHSVQEAKAFTFSKIVPITTAMEEQKKEEPLALSSWGRDEGAAGEKAVSE